MLQNSKEWIADTRNFMGKSHRCYIKWKKTHTHIIYNLYDNGQAKPTSGERS